MAQEREEGKMSGIAQSIRVLWEGKADVDVGFRTIRTSWMLLLVAAAYTVIISPYMLLTPLYQSQYGFVTIFFGIFIVAWLGDLVGKNIIKKYFQDEIIKGEEHKLPLGNLRIAQISIIIVLFILIMDGVSVAEESYYYVHKISFIFLVITIIFLNVLPIIIRRKRGG
jgi:hypothetical protein